MIARVVELAGAKRSSRADAMIRFREAGVTFSKESLTQIRAQKPHAGSHIARWLTEARLIGADDSSKKNQYYLEVIEAGQSLRTHQHNAYHPNAFKSDGFTEAIAGEIRVKPFALDRGIRAMRVDMVCEDIFTDQSGTNQVLIDAAGRFFQDYLNCSSSYVSEPKKRLNGLWVGSDFQTTVIFYKLLYSMIRSRRSIGTWVPYELDVMHAFYSMQREKGDKLTLFDLLTLRGEISGRSFDALSGAIKHITQIPCDRNILMTHRNVLLKGSFETK
ncbi:MAG: hypothetical protein NUV73_02060 [Candidatus Daviesbacteria bacterium]|nr:hypothetical protein [Candidatus Daviesbacteria bacterium]